MAIQLESSPQIAPRMPICLAVFAVAAILALSAGYGAGRLLGSAISSVAGDSKPSPPAQQSISPPPVEQGSQRPTYGADPGDEKDKVARSEPARKRGKENHGEEGVGEVENKKEEVLRELDKLGSDAKESLREEVLRELGKIGSDDKKEGEGNNKRKPDKTEKKGQRKKGERE